MFLSIFSPLFLLLSLGYNIHTLFSQTVIVLYIIYCSNKYASYFLILQFIYTITSFVLSIKKPSLTHEFNLSVWYGKQMLLLVGNVRISTCWFQEDEKIQKHIKFKVCITGFIWFPNNSGIFVSRYCSAWSKFNA